MRDVQNINVLAWQNTMKTLDLCFEDWRSQMESSGQRKVRTSNVVQLTLKVSGRIVGINAELTLVFTIASTLRHSWCWLLALSCVERRCKRELDRSPLHVISPRTTQRS